MVVWDNRTFDLTASANNPSSQIAQNLDCGTGSGGQYVFSFLTTCPTAIYYGVSSAASGNIPGFASFNFAAPAPAVGIGEEGLIGASFDSADDNNYVKGTFEVSAAPAVTPEPGSLVLMMSGMLALAGCAWRRSALRGVLPTAR